MTIAVVSLALIAALSANGPAFARVTKQGDTFTVDDVEGYAAVKNGDKNAAREDAKREAYRDALEKAIGATVTGITETENFEVIRDKVFSQTTGIVKTMDITREWVDDDGMFRLEAVCKVAVAALDGVLGPVVIEELGNPRIMIIVQEAIYEDADKQIKESVKGDAGMSFSRVEAEASPLFEKAGFHMVDYDQAAVLTMIDGAYDNPGMVMDLARTQNADIIILGKAEGIPFAKQKISGITMYGVKGTVQLKAVLTETATLVSSITLEQATGKKPAPTVEEGAVRCFKEAASIASKQLVNKIAYALATERVTTNIKISDLSFKEVTAIMKSLNELAGRSGTVTQRGFKDGVLVADMISRRTAMGVAEYLEECGIEVVSFGAHTVGGKKMEPVPVDDMPEVAQMPDEKPNLRPGIL
ncbi:MAG: hypothetical protein LBQ36_01625 [Synergistaceae bacterium]|nr:hypothetical protein [Synergistaceae bacterium]